MNKEEILSKSRSEKNDEGILFILNKGNQYGSTVFLVAILALILFTVIMWRVADSALLMTVLWTYLTGHFIGYAKADHQKRTGLIMVSLLATAVCFGTYLNQILF
ncbi:MAG: DUF6442 family protein [Coprobacillus sp.]